MYLLLQLLIAAPFMIVGTAVHGRLGFIVGLVVGGLSASYGIKALRRRQSYQSVLLTSDERDRMAFALHEANVMSWAVLPLTNANSFRIEDYAKIVHKNTLEKREDVTLLQHALYGHHYAVTQSRVKPEHSFRYMRRATRGKKGRQRAYAIARRCCELIDHTHGPVTDMKAWIGRWCAEMGHPRMLDEVWAEVFQGRDEYSMAMLSMAERDDADTMDPETFASELAKREQWNRESWCVA